MAAAWDWAEDGACPLVTPFLLPGRFLRPGVAWLVLSFPDACPAQHNLAFRPGAPATKSVRPAYATPGDLEAPQKARCVDVAHCSSRDLID